jgi:outer membrane protein assembly factor BamB
MLRIFDASSGRPGWTRRLTRLASSVVAGPSAVLVQDRELVALDPGTGAVKWSRSIVGSAPGTPAVGSGVVVVPSGDPGPLVALDLRNGRQLWAVTAPYRTRNPARAFERRFATPLIVDGLAIAWTDAPNPRDGGRLLGIDLRSGKVVWRHRFAQGMTGVTLLGGQVVGCSNYRRFTIAALDGRIVRTDGEHCAYNQVPGRPRIGLVDFGSEGVVAVDLARAQELWRVPLRVDSALGARAVGRGTALYVPSENEFTDPPTGGLRAIDAGTGREVWRVDIDGGVSARPALAGGLVFVASGLDCRDANCVSRVYALRRS